MAVAFQEEDNGKVLVLALTGKLTKQDYETFLPEVERLITRHRKVRMLVHMHDFHGWKLSALWEDIKFDVKHFAHIERLAFVGEKKWEAGMAVFCKPFTTAAVRYFDAADYDAALAWLNERVAQPADARDCDLRR